MKKVVKIQGNFRFEKSGRDRYEIEKSGVAVGYAKRDRYGYWDIHRTFGPSPCKIGCGPSMIDAALRSFPNA